MLIVIFFANAKLNIDGQIQTECPQFSCFVRIAGLSVNCPKIEANSGTSKIQAGRIPIGLIATYC